MNGESCREFEERLVDYADGELLPDEGQRVRHHIEQCARCRTTVDALRESMHIAEMIWQDNLEEMQAVRDGPSRWVRLWKWRHVAAAAILIAIGGAVFWSVSRRPTDAPLTLAEIERRVTQSATAARLLAATDLLRAQKDAQDVVQGQYRHILQRYPDTEAAVQARLRLESTR